MRELAEIQTWMQSVVMNLGGARAGVASPEARGIIDVSPEDAETVVARSRALTGLERLDIYNRAYFARLVECLREEFPAFAHAVGEEAFAEFAVGYLDKYPSRSYTLNHLGSRFPLYLAETRPRANGKKKSEDGGPRKAAWTDFLIDLASLELAYGEVFDGAGVEGKPLLDAATLGAITPQRWTEARLVPIVCFRLLRMRYPAHVYAAAIRKKHDAVFPKPRATYLAITRRNYIVRRYTLSRIQFLLLDALREGQRVGRAIEHAATAADGQLDKLETGLRKWFHDWTAEGFFQEVQVPA